MSNATEAVQAYGEFYRHETRYGASDGYWRRIVWAKEYPTGANERWVVIAGNGEPRAFATRAEAEQDAEHIIERRCIEDLRQREVRS